MQSLFIKCTTRGTSCKPISTRALVKVNREKDPHFHPNTSYIWIEYSSVYEQNRLLGRLLFKITIYRLVNDPCCFIIMNFPPLPLITPYPYPNGATVLGFGHSFALQYLYNNDRFASPLPAHMGIPHEHIHKKNPGIP